MTFAVDWALQPQLLYPGHKMCQTIRLTSEVGARASKLSTRSNYHGGKQGRDGNPMLKHGRLMAEDLNKRVITLISGDIAAVERG